MQVYHDMHRDMHRIMRAAYRGSPKTNHTPRCVPKHEVSLGRRAQLQHCPLSMPQLRRVPLVSPRRPPATTQVASLGYSDPPGAQTAPPMALA